MGGLSGVPKLSDGSVVDPAVVVGKTSGELSIEQAIPIFAGMFLLAGIVLLYGPARGPIGRARRYLGMEAFDPVTGHDPDVLVGVSGRIRGPETTVTGPMTDADCVVYEKKEQVLREEYKYDTAERRRRKRSSVSDDEAEKRVWRWKTTSADRDQVPFHVETEHGPVLVDPAGAELAVPVQASETSSPVWRILYRAVPLRGLFGRFLDPPTRTIERHVEPGDSVLVIGAAQPRADDDLVGSVSRAGHGDVFRVTTRSGRSLAFWSTLKAFLTSLPGILCILVGIGIVGWAVSSGMYW